MYKIKSPKKLFIYILSLIGISLIIILLYVNRPVILECRYGPYKDKDGINKIDFLPYSVLKINKITRKLTFYNIGSIKSLDESLSMSDSVSFRSVRSMYETDYIKQKKLNEEEKRFLNDKSKEYLFPDLKGEEYKMSVHRSDLRFFIIWKNPHKKAVKNLFPEGSVQYMCSFPKKKKKSKYKKPKNKI